MSPFSDLASRIEWPRYWWSPVIRRNSDLDREPFLLGSGFAGFEHFQDFSRVRFRHWFAEPAQYERRFQEVLAFAAQRFLFRQYERLRRLLFPPPECGPTQLIR